MKRWILILPILLPLLASGAAEAGGRWGVRLELPFQAVAYVEQVAWSTSWKADDPGPLDLLGVEILAGTEAIRDDETTVTPYLGVATYWTSTWARMEVATPWRLPESAIDYRISLSIGGSWD